MLGPRPVDMLAWESFGEGWVTDVAKELKLKDARVIKAAYGELPDLGAVDTRTRDVVFTWNGTTSGVRVPDADWIAADRAGAHDLRRHLGRLRAAARFRQARCRHLLLAEGARRRGGPRHADPVAARRRAAGELHAALAAAEDLPHDEGRQAHRGHLRGRDHQHPVHALRRGLHRRARMGEGARRARRPHRAGPTPMPRRSSTGWRGRPGSRTSRDCRRPPRTPASASSSPTPTSSPRARGRLQRSRRASPRRSRRKASPSTSAPTAMPRRACASGAARRSSAPIFEALTPWLDWAFAQEKAKLAKAA